MSRDFVPAQTTISCDRCRKEIKEADLILSIDQVFRDYQGAAAAGNQMKLDFCQDCAYMMMSAIEDCRAEGDTSVVLPRKKK